MINTTNNTPINIRAVSIFLKDFSNGENNHYTDEHYNADSELELIEAEKAWDAWHEKTYPSCDNVKLANEAFFIKWELCNTHSRVAFEKGMKAGAKLIMNLLDINR